MVGDRLSPRMAVYGTLFLTLGGTAQLAAQEVQWRIDYVAARREAKETRRPIIIDFGTASCFWCKKLDVSTFRDPEIAKQLNEQFIPIKIDGERDAGLVQALHIQSYPTLVFAAPDGRILGTQEGFVDASRLGQQLDRARKDSAEPSLLPSTDRPPSSRELLVSAQQDERRRLYLGCLERCALLTSTYPDSAEADEARQLTLKIKTDPAIAPQLCRQLADQLGDLYMAQAESAMRAHDRQGAASFLERVLQASPGTARAELAQTRLDRLQNSLASQPLPPPKTARGQAQ